MKRRDFLTNLAAVGAGAAMSGRLRAQAANTPKRSPNDRIQVALIGAQNIGGKTHLPTLVGSDEVQLTTVCDVDSDVMKASAEKAAQLYAEKNGSGSYSGIRQTMDFREIMQSGDIDAVVIGTPDHWHVPIAKAAIKAGKDVYVEKPLSFYVTEGRELIDLVKPRDAILQVGSQHRSTDYFFMAQAIIQSGLIGEVRHADVMIKTRNGSPEPWEPQPVPANLDYNMYVGPASWTDYHPERVHYNFRFVPEFSGGEIANWGAHFLDSYMQAMGLDGIAPVSVKADGKRNPTGSLHTSFYDIDVDYVFPDGVTMNMSSAPDSAIRFYGSKGTLFVSRKKIETFPEQLIRETPRDLMASYRKTKGSHMNNWFSCMRSRRKQDLHAPVEIGHQGAVLCHLANIAIDLKRELHWDGEREIFKNDAYANAMLSHPVRTDWES